MTIFYFLIFILGTLIGSFVSVVIVRWDSEEGFISGRSRCVYCRKNLKPWQMVPVISWSVQLGKCAFCKQKIGWSYPMLEIVTGLLFVVLAYQLVPNDGNALNLVTVVTFSIYALFMAGLVAIFEIDRRTMYIPDIIVWPLIGLFLLFLMIDGVMILGGGSALLTMGLMYADFFPDSTGLLLGPAAGAGLFGLLYLVSQGKWMGLGDVKLGLLIGLYLGFVQTMVALYAAIILGGVYGIVMLATKKNKRGDVVPFGPFLVAGALFALLTRGELFYLLFGS